MRDRLSNLDRHPEPEAFTAGFGVWPLGEGKKKGKAKGGKTAKPPRKRKK